MLVFFIGKFIMSSSLGICGMVYDYSLEMSCKYLQQFFNERWNEIVLKSDGLDISVYEIANWKSEFETLL